VTVGGIDHTGYRGELKSHDLVKKLDLWWTLNYSGLAYDGEKMGKSEAKYAIMDTGTSIIYLPKTDYDNFRRKLHHIDELDCSDKYDFCVSKYHHCDDINPKLANFTILLDNVWYTIPPKGYTLPNEQGFQCMVAISHIPDSEEIILLGDTFFRNFYTSFDYEKDVVSMGVNAAAYVGQRVE